MKNSRKIIWLRTLCYDKKNVNDHPFNLFTIPGRTSNEDLQFE